MQSAIQAILFESKTLTIKLCNSLQLKLQSLAGNNARPLLGDVDLNSEHLDEQFDGLQSFHTPLCLGPRSFH